MKNKIIVPFYGKKKKSLNYLSFFFVIGVYYWCILQLHSYLALYMNKKTTITLGVIISIAIALSLFLLYIFLYPIHIQQDEKKTFLYIYPQETMEDVIGQFQEKTGVQSTIGFEIVAHALRFENPRAGRYEINNGENNLTLVRRLRSGDQSPIHLKVSSVRTKEQLVRNLSKQLMCDSISIATLLSDSVFLASHKLNPDIATLFFIPNTYEVFWTMTPKQLFDRMEREYKSFWTEERKQKAAAIPLTPTEVSILAAIVDSETRSVREKPTVAGLYINRLRKGMPLQADPTVIFAVGDFSIRRVLIAHTKTPSPYNTYLNKGLPPGLIRTPSISGIESVLNYEQSNYIFMCASETFNGEHNFAASWSEHIANARRYQHALNERGIKK